jgi:flagellar hook-basal body complex protein FliE
MEVRFGDVGPVRYTPLGRPAAEPEPGPDFGETLKGALSEVNRLQLDAGEKTRALVAGEDVDLHEVMISAQEAGVAFDLMMEIRNKLVEAYQEIQRMQV